MILYPPLTALTVDGKLLVEGHKYEEPKFFCRIGQEDSPEIHAHYKRHDEWQASKVRYPVCDDDIFELKKAISETIDYKNHIIEISLEKGIYISHLSERIEVINVFKGASYNKGTQDTDVNSELQIKLKPMHEEESQETLWMKVHSILNETDSMSNRLDKVKEQFTITRKQP